MNFNFDWIKSLLMIFHKTPLQKQKFYFSKIFPIIGIIGVISFSIYLFSYKQPDNFIENYQEYLQRNDGYLEHAWDCIHETCRKRNFRGEPDFRQRQLSSTFEDVTFSKVGGWAFSDYFPKKRDYISTFKKIETISKIHLNQNRGHWLFAKNPAQYYHVALGNKTTITFDYKLKYQLQKIENRWNIISIDTVSVAIIY